MFNVEKKKRSKEISITVVKVEYETLPWFRRFYNTLLFRNSQNIVACVCFPLCKYLEQPESEEYFMNISSQCKRH